MSQKTISIDETAFSMGGSPRSRKGRKGGKKPSDNITSPVNDKYKKELLNKIRNAINKTNKNNESKSAGARKSKPKPAASTSATASTTQVPQDDVFSYFSSLGKKCREKVEKRNQIFFVDDEKEDKSESENRPSLKIDLGEMDDNSSSSRHFEEDTTNGVEVISQPSSPSLSLSPSPQPLTLSSPTLSTPKLSTPNVTKEVPYGILKGGTKPTYRTWKNHTHKSNFKKTLRKYDTHKEMRKFAENKYPNSESIDADETESFGSAKEKLNKIRSTIKENKVKQRENAENQENGSFANVTVVRKTRRTKVKPGKNPAMRKITVVMTNEKHRSLIKKGINELLDKSICDIQRYLKDKNILHSGSLAPNVLMRQLYLQSHLSGGGENINKNTVVENFLDFSQK